MCNFFTILPFEIIQEIISYIDQNDSIECACVCHEWYDRIPAYSTILWERLEISSTIWKFSNHNMIRCLGSHVQDVSIHQSNSTWNILKRLGSLGCGIIVLEVIKDASFQDLEQYTTNSITRVIRQRQLIIATTLQRFSATLTQLTITNHWNKNVSVFHLLNKLPNLTHLSLFFPDDENIINNSNNNGKSPKTTTMIITNLVYLHLDFKLGFHSTILPIIHHTPQLCSLILTNQKFMDSITIVDISTILQQCPQLHNFMCERSPSITVVNEVLCERWRTTTTLTPSSSSSSLPNNKKHVLREKGDNSLFDWDIITTCDKRDTATLGEIVLSCDGPTVYNVATTMIRASKARLEYLGLENPFYDSWDFIFDDIDNTIGFPGLKKLELQAVTLSEDTWMQLGTYCQHVETLNIVLATQEYMPWTSTIQGVGKMQHLQKLELYYWGSIFGPDQEETYHPGICDNIHLLAHCPELHTIYLRNICLSRQNFLDLTKIPKLYRVTISMQRHHSCNTADDLLAFADAMDTRDEQHKIRFLTFENCFAFTDTIYERFMYIQGLTKLTVHNV